MLDSIRYFRATMESGTTREAARLLRISPSAVSKAIKRLETLYSIKLFEPHGRGLVPTESARRLYALSSNVVAEVENLSAEMKSGARLPVTRLGTYEVFSTHVLTRLFDCLPNSGAVVVGEVVPGEIEPALNERLIDIGITHVPFPNPALEHLEVTRFSIGVFAVPGAFEGVELTRVPFAEPLTTMRGVPLAVRTMDCWPAQFPVRHVPFKFGMLQTGLLAASRGHCALFCPEFVVRLYNESLVPEARLVPLPAGEAYRAHGTVYVARRREGPEWPGLSALCRGLRKLCRP